MKYPILFRQIGRVLVMAVLALALPNVFAEGPSLPVSDMAPPPDLSRPTIVPLRILAMPVLDLATTPPSRVRVFRMQPGFLSEVPWLSDDDQTTAGTPKPKADPLSNLFLSVGALGQTTIDTDSGRTLNWDVMPGMHYRLAENWWVSGGVLLPVGPTRVENGGHWRLTCQWQF